MGSRTFGPPLLQDAVREVAMQMRYREAVIESAEWLASFTWFRAADEVHRDQEDEFIPFGSEHNGCVIVEVE